MPSATVATKLVAKFKVIPVRPNNPKKIAIGNKLGIKAITPTFKDPNKIAKMIKIISSAPDKLKT